MLEIKSVKIDDDSPIKNEKAPKRRKLKIDSDSSSAEETSENKYAKKSIDKMEVDDKVENKNKKFKTNECKVILKDCKEGT